MQQNFVKSCLILWVSALSALVTNAVEFGINLTAPGFKVSFDRGQLDQLVGRNGEKMATGGGFSSAIEFGGRFYAPDQYKGDGQSICGTFLNAPLAGATLTTDYAVDPATGDVVFTQKAATPQGGLSKVRWSVGNVPLDWRVIVPNAGGMQITKDTPDAVLNSAGPMFWEFPLVIYENPKGGGFYVFSDTLDWPFTQISVKRGPKGFVTDFFTENKRPYQDKQSIVSLQYRINVFDGDWRTAAARIKQLWESKLRAASPPQPAWVKNIDLVIFDQKMDPKYIEWLLKYYQIDPARTLVYLNHWRKGEFDRDYPTYNELNPKVPEFVKYLKSKGFRVMIHANWFGCTPGHPVHQLVENALIRNPDGSLRRYSNLRKNPPLFIDYVNPASPVWRDEFVRRMQEAVALTGADGLHLDQNQHCHNYDGGVIGDMSMIEGTLALHQALRKAMPEVALSGEGSNGLTARYLAFAQRTIWSLTPQQIDPNDYQRYHPISNYVFGDSVAFYGWLGVGDPSLRGGQLYAAWRDGLSRTGTLPTIRTLFINDEKELANPDGFRKLEMAEVAAVAKDHLRPDYTGEWGPTIRLPWKSQDGKTRTVMTNDGSFAYLDGKIIGQTVIGVRQYTGPGTIANQYYYNSQKIMGLSPSLYYAVEPIPRDLTRFHIESLPPELAVADVTVEPSKISFAVVSDGAEILSLTDGVDSLTKSTEGLDGSWNKAADALGRGELQKRGNMILMRPPAKGTGQKVNDRPQAEGTGMMSASWKVTLPADQSEFVSGLTMHGNSLGNGASDGVLFRVEAKADGKAVLSKEYYFDCRGMELADNKIIPFALDLSPLAESEIELVLKLGAGPANNATSDDAFWVNPRIVKKFAGTGRVEAVVPFAFRQLLRNGSPIAFEQKGDQVVFDAGLPGSFIIEKEQK